MSEWISIKDRLPEENQIVLIWNEDHGCLRRNFHDRKFYYEFILGSYDEKISHWMSQPEPPK